MDCVGCVLLKGVEMVCVGCVLLKGVEVVCVGCVLGCDFPAFLGTAQLILTGLPQMISWSNFSASVKDRLSVKSTWAYPLNSPVSLFIPNRMDSILQSENSFLRSSSVISHDKFPRYILL